MMAKIIYLVLTSFQVLIIIRVLLSWFGLERGNSFSEFVYDFTEPLLAKLRVLVIPLGGMALDISPILAVLLLNLLAEIFQLLASGGRIW